MFALFLRRICAMLLKCTVYLLKEHNVYPRLCYENAIRYERKYNNIILYIDKLYKNRSSLTSELLYTQYSNRAKFVGLVYHIIVAASNNEKNVR